MLTCYGRFWSSLLYLIVLQLWNPGDNWLHSLHIITQLLYLEPDVQWHNYIKKAFETIIANYVEIWKTGGTRSLINIALPEIGRILLPSSNLSWSLWEDSRSHAHWIYLHVSRSLLCLELITVKCTWYTIYLSKCSLSSRPRISPQQN